MHLVGVTLQELYDVFLVIGVVVNIIVFIYLQGFLLVVIDTLLAFVILLVLAIVVSCVWTAVLHVLLSFESLEVLCLYKLVSVYLGDKVIDVKLHFFVIIICLMLVRFGCAVDSSDELVKYSLGHYRVVIQIVAAVTGCIHLLLINIVTCNKLKGLLGSRSHLKARKSCTHAHPTIHYE
jgi:hypothetical protein